MMLHNRDIQGDWLPVTVSGAVLRGSEAVGRLVEDRLKLFQNEWWEDPAEGNPALELFRNYRPTSANLTQIINTITAYIQETPGILSAEDIQGSVENRQILYSCRVHTSDGETSISVLL